MDSELAAAASAIPDLSFEQLDRTRQTLDELGTAAPPEVTGVRVEQRQIAGPQGAPDVTVWIFSPNQDGGGRQGESSRSGVLDIHGGGFCIGSASLDHNSNAAIASEVGAVVVSVEYRLAPEHPFPAGAEDCYAALVWLAEHVGELGVDPSRIAVLGDSSGGGLAATTALLARDRGGPALTMQLLLEPELDDRLETQSMKASTDTVGWRYSQAVLSWRYYIGDAKTPPLHAAPARTEDISGLPPTYLTVNELDPLRDEGLHFAHRLLWAGVPTELHAWPGTFHGFRTLMPTARVSQRAAGELHDALRRGVGTSVSALSAGADQPA